MRSFGFEMDGSVMNLWLEDEGLGDGGVGKTKGFWVVFFGFFLLFFN